MTQDFVMGQLRLALVALLAFAGGKGWLTPTDSSLVLAFVTALGPLFAPWIWSIVSNINTKRVPQHMVVIDPVVTPANSDNVTATVKTAAGTMTGKVVSALLVAFVVSAFLAGNPAMAQKSGLPHLQITGNPIADTKANFGLTGNASADMQALWQKIVGSSLNDLNYAAAMAKNANTLQAKTRLECINAIIALNKQASGIDLKDDAGNPLPKPDPHVFTDVETLAEVVDNLAPTGPLFVSCAGAAQLAKTNVLSFVNAVVTGAAGFAAMPIIPGL